MCSAQGGLGMGVLRKTCHCPIRSTQELLSSPRKKSWDSHGGDERGRRTLVAWAVLRAAGQCWHSLKTSAEL